MFFPILKLTIILIVIPILHESITVTLAIFELSSIYLSRYFSAFYNSVTVVAIILLLSIVDFSGSMFLCKVTFLLAMFELPPVTVPTPVILFHSNSMKLIFMPFSDKLVKFTYHYPNSLSLTLCIKVASVLAHSPKILVIFVFNIFEPVDGLRFSRLNQILNHFFFAYTLSLCIWKHLEGVVNHLHFLTFSLHDDFKTLMCCS